MLKKLIGPSFVLLLVLLPEVTAAEEQAVTRDSCTTVEQLRDIFIDLALTANTALEMYEKDETGTALAEFSRLVKERGITRGLTLRIELEPSSTNESTNSMSREASALACIEKPTTLAVVLGPEDDAEGGSSSGGSEGGSGGGPSGSGGK